MKFQCGPSNDPRILEISLPLEKKKLGVFISGGMDSAILYFLILLENKNLGNIHEITPFSIRRKEGSKYFAELAIAYVHEYFNIPYVDPTYLGDTSLNEDQQVGSGVLQAILDLKIDICYTGLIEQLPQHMVGWKPIPYTITDHFQAPFHNLNKSHIVDLVNQLHQTGLFHITHSCSVLELGRCRNCNGCNERQWGFDKVGLTDPGKI